MKFKCGNCGQVSQAEPMASKSFNDDRFILLRCHSCGNTNKIPKPEIPKAKQEDDSKTEIINANFLRGDDIVVIPGWLFVHDENTPMQSFDLRIGENIIGRKSSENNGANIAIETKDGYMSRVHCVINVIKTKAGEFQFQLSDHKAVNGTILNGVIQKKLAPQEILALKDGDTIQLGATKVVLRYYKHNYNRARVQAEVEDLSYAPTVIVSKKK